MPEVAPGKYLVTAGWADVPHIDEAEAEKLLDSCPPHLREARQYGTPNIGAGAIYPYKWDDISCDSFQIPAHYYLGYGIDVGWKKTAEVWGAHDRDTDVLYIWSEHYQGEAEPPIHAAAINSRALWKLPGNIDPAARGRAQRDGQILMDNYVDLGLNLNKADNAVESGLLEVQTRMSTGRLKFFKTLPACKFEQSLYRRNDKGMIVKEHDHAMDALRYLCMGTVNMMQRPVHHDPGQLLSTRNSRTGY